MKKSKENSIGTNENAQSFIKREERDKQVLNGNKITQYYNTVFHIVEMKDETVIVIGNDIVKGGYKNYDEAFMDLKDKPWELIFNGVYVWLKKIEETIKENK